MNVEVRLHRELYGDKAIEEAISLYADHARIERRSETDYVVLSVDADREGRASRVARELANYALGLTIQSHAAGAAKHAPAANAAEPTR